MQRLARHVDALLLSDDGLDRAELRSLRLLTTDALHALGAVVEHVDGPRWSSPLEAALRAIGAEYSAATGAATHIRVQGRVDRLSKDVAGAVRRVATEALRNVDRHARASFMLLSLEIDDDGVRLDIVDDGVDIAGRQVTAWGSAVDLGLRRMGRAMGSVGGTLTVHPLRPRGLRLRAVAPCVARSRP